MLRIWTKHFWDSLLFQLLVTLGLVGLSSHAPSLGVVLCSCSSASSPAPHLPHQHCLHHQSGKQALLIPQCASPVVFKLLSVMSLSLHFTTFSPWLRSGSILRSISLSLMSWSNTSGIPHWKTHNFCLPTQQPMTSAAVTKQTTGPPTASPPRIVSKLSLILCKLTFVCRISATSLPGLIYLSPSDSSLCRLLCLSEPSSQTSAPELINELYCEPLSPGSCLRDCLLILLLSHFTCSFITNNFYHSVFFL